MEKDESSFMLRACASPRRGRGVPQPGFPERSGISADPSKAESRVRAGRTEEKQGQLPKDESVVLRGIRDRVLDPESGLPIPHPYSPTASSTAQTGHSCPCPPTRSLGSGCAPVTWLGAISSLLYPLQLTGAVVNGLVNRGVS